MTIEIRYRGEHTVLDRLPDGVSRLAFIASMLTVAEMQRLLVGTDARDICSSLGIGTVSRDSEKVMCTKIWEHYHG